MRVKYLSKDQLIQAARLSVKNNYNRQLDAANLTDLGDYNYPIVFSMVHEHRAGVSCDPHMRLIVAIFPDPTTRPDDHQNCAVDVPMDFYDALPDYEVVKIVKT